MGKRACLMKVVTSRLAAIRAASVSNIPDAMLIGGAVSVSYGSWLVYEPAGFIVAGLLLLVAGVLASKAG